MALLAEARAAVLESAIDTLEDTLPALKTFVIPGGSPAGAHLHQARTVCRRAERRILSAAEHTPIRSDILVYLNRLSDLLFVLARVVNRRAGLADIPWGGP